jgi:hypothetical protein
MAAIVAVVGASIGLRTALAEPDPVEGQQRVEMLAAHAVARVALCDLKDVGTPTLRDYRIAEELLATAATLLPNDQTILRLYMEAAAAANDTTAVRDIARRLVRLDPDDSVSLLRVVSARISDLQTSDERLAAYDQFVSGEGSESFDKAVRSRLALDASLLARERGDMTGFAERLSKAIALDPTNRDAATLALDFYSPRADANEPTGRLDLMFQVLWTDPFDPSIYSSIVSELLSKGAGKGAFRFAKLQRRIYGIQQRPMPEADELAYDLAEWAVSGPEPIIRRLSDELEQQRQQAIERRKSVSERSVGADALPSPESIRLPVARERSRVVCASALLDRERATVFLSDFAASIASMTRDAADPVRRNPNLTEAQAVAQAREASIDLCWLRLLAGVQLEDAGKSLAEFRASGALDQSTLARLDAWNMLRTGDKEQAERTLATLAPRDPLAAIGHALAAELRADPNTAIVRYAEIARREVGNFVGAFATTRYSTLFGEQLPATEVSRALEADAAGVPQSLDGMVDSPRRVMSMEVTALTPDIQPIERTPVRVTIRNTSWIALAMGPDKPICTRLLFAPQVDVGSEIMPTSDLVWIANMDRRLRLLPNESVDMIVWPDLGPLSFEMEYCLPRQARIRWRVLQGFELSAQRLYDAAPQMLTTDIVPLVRRLPSRAQAVVGSLESALQTGGPREIADVILSLKLQIVQAKDLLEKPLDLNQVDRLLEVISRRAASSSWPRASKILALCLMPSQKLLPQALRLDQVALQDTDEEVLAVALVTRAVKPNDPLFTAPAVLRSPRLAALAQLVKDRLEAGVSTFSTVPLFVTTLVSTAPRAAAPDPAKPAGSGSASDPGSAIPTSAPPARIITPTVPPDPNPIPIVW